VDLGCKVNLFKNLFSRHPHQEIVTAPDSCAWLGESGTEYPYQIYPLDAEFRPLPGNYIYAAQNEAGGWVPIYISQTRDLHQRLEGHVTLQDAIEHGATHIHVHYSTAGQGARCTEEQDLIHRWQPECNDVIQA